MIIMTIDHLIHLNPYIPVLSDPVDVLKVPPLLFFFRWIGHLCAPTFILLCGMSVFAKQYLKQLPPKEISTQIFKRGLWLILLELTVVNFGWTLNVVPFKLFLQVIFAIGCGLLFLALLVRYFSISNILWISFVLILLDNLLNVFPLKIAEQGWNAYIFAVIHQKTTFSFFNDQFIIRTTYPVLSWLGVIGIGYYLGQFYVKNDVTKIQKTTFYAFFCIALVPVIRYFNFGDPHPYVLYPSTFKTCLSFFNFTKYPPSLLFLMTFIPICLLVMRCIHFSFFRHNILLGWLGRHALGYYIIHIYLITLVYKAVVFFFPPL